MIFFSIVHLYLRFVFIISGFHHKMYGFGAALGQGSKITFLFTHHIPFSFGPPRY